MSCQFKTVANIVDLEKIKRCLFHSSQIKSDSTSKGSSDNDPWDWSTNENDKQQSDNANDCKWVNDSHIAISPTEELMVIAYQRSMVILVSKWDSNEESTAKTKYYVSWSGELCHAPNELITSVICLPLAASHSRSSAHCGADWTAIAVGFSSGALRFYTETGSLLFAEVLHQEPVTGIKCQSYQQARLSAGSEQNEELHVIYKNVVCCIFGFALCNTLRACRNQLARVQANCNDSSTSIAPPLSMRKFSLPEQGTVSDICVGAMQCPTGFAHLSTASICGGYQAWYRPTPPQSSLILATGSKPFVGFHYAIEGTSAPVLTDVAKAMATKLKSAIGQAVPGWLMGARKSNSQQEKVKDPVEPAEPMACRFGLCDLWRQGDRIVMSPNRKLSVVSDTLGRVILIDNSSGVALRMWKGYRDAECGWIICHEEKKSHERRTAMFLVIYVPRKGIIEVWALQQGPRVATFPASKTGKLLYIGHNLLGLSSITSSKVNTRCVSSCVVFLDQTGALKEITVPFHCALSDKNSKRARDVLLLKKLKSSLREEGGLSEIHNICKELQTNEMKLQGLDILCLSRYMTVDILLSVIDLFSATLSSTHQDSVDEILDPGGKALLDKCNQLEHLVTFYNFLSGLRQKPPDYSTVVSSTSASDDAEMLRQLIQITPEEMNKILSVSSKKAGEGGPSRSIKFQDSAANLSNFLSALQKSGEPNEIILNNSLSSDKMFAISEVVCQGCLDGNCSVDEWQNAACASRIPPFDLMTLAITFWLNKQSHSGSLALDMIHFSKLVKAVCFIAGENVKWWDKVRSLLRDGNDPIAALSAALVCRSVASSVENLFPDLCAVNNNKGGGDESDDESSSDNGNKENNNYESPEKGDNIGCESVNDVKVKNDNSSMSNSTNDIMDWENISQDSCQWSQLISQLEDVALLYSVLSKTVVDVDKEAHLKVSVLDYRKPDISLGILLTKGKGSIPEMVAKWVSSSGLDPLLLLEKQSLDGPNSNRSISLEPNSVSAIGITEGIAEQTESCMEALPIGEKHSKMIDDLSLLRQHFPYSLTSSSLLVNLCWEYVLAWNRDVDSITNLLSAINCIKIINDPHLRQGICTMIWSTHLRSRFEAALRLINKVGKVAKERLCRQDVGLSDLQMADFFSVCSDFIDTYMESNVMSEIQEKIPLRSEALWEGCSPIPSLSQLALTQPTANYDLLHLLSQATRAMLLLATFNLRTHRPLNAFFDSVGQGALFSDIWSQPQLPGHSHDVKLIESRTKFLLRAVSASVCTVVGHQQQEWDTKQAIQWMTQCLSLAADWSVPVDPLRRQQACQLYAKGFDRLAEEVIPAITDTTQFGSQLLVIVGQRLNKSLLTSNKDLKRKITNLSPTLTSWISELGDGTVDNCSLSETAHLAVVALNLLPDDHSDRHIARQLADSLQQITESFNVASNSTNHSSADDKAIAISGGYIQ